MISGKNQQNAQTVVGLNQHAQTVVGLFQFARF